MAYEQHGGGVVPVGEEGREEAISAFEEADAAAIIAHLSTGGVELEDFVYSFPIEGREVVGISWAGAKEIARQLGNIEVLREIKVEERDGAFYGLVWVRDITRNVTILGAARQPKEKTLKSGGVKADEHAFVVAINKAQRNGILALVDEAVKQRLVSAFLSSHKKALVKGGAPVASTASSPSMKGDRLDPATAELVKRRGWQEATFYQWIVQVQGQPWDKLTEEQRAQIRGSFRAIVEKEEKERGQAGKALL